MATRTYQDGKLVSIDGEQVEQYLERMRACESTAEQKIRRVFRALDWTGDWEQPQRILIDAMAQLAEQYGSAQAEVASAFLEQQLMAQGDAVGAQIVRNATADAMAAAQPINRNPIESVVHTNVKLAARGDTGLQQFENAVSAKTGEQVKQRGQYLSDRMVVRSEATANQLGRKTWKMEVAWVPGDAYPCGFCVILASQGWRQAKSRALSEYKDHIHPNCHCELIFRAPGVEIDYDGEEYHKKLADAVGVESLMDTDRRTWRNAAAAYNVQRYKIPAYGDRIRLQHREAYARNKDTSE